MPFMPESFTINIIITFTVRPINNNVNLVWAIAIIVIKSCGDIKWWHQVMTSLIDSCRQPTHNNFIKSDSSFLNLDKTAASVKLEHQASHDQVSEPSPPNGSRNVAEKYRFTPPPSSSEGTKADVLMHDISSSAGIFSSWYICGCCTIDEYIVKALITLFQMPSQSAYLECISDQSHMIH